MAYAGTMKHPALRLYIVTIALLALTVLMGFIAVFVPWAMKDIAPGQRAWAYPFKTCIEETFSTVNKETCMDNDFIEPEGVPLTGGSSTCKAFILATIAFVFLSVLGGVVLLLVLIFVVDKLWTKPTCVAVGAQGGLILICIFCFLSWIMFIVYAEMTCAPDSIFPVHGYSYGFIIYIFATALSIGSVVTGFMALKALKGFVPLKEQQSDAEEPLHEYPVYNPEPVVPNAPESTPQRSFNNMEHATY